MTKMAARRGAGHRAPAKAGRTKAYEAAEAGARQGRAGDSVESEPGPTSGVTSRLLSKMGAPGHHQVRAPGTRLRAKPSKAAPLRPRGAPRATTGQEGSRS